MEDLKDSDLIDGLEALRALADGKDVQVLFKENIGAGWYSSETLKRMTIEKIINGNIELRIKPQTIKLELELPKPFEPKVGEWFYYLSAEHEDGYGSRRMHDDTPKYLINLGAYRTEDEIKQVVEQLRKIKGAV